MSWYKLDRELTKEERRYIHFLSEIFRVPDASGKLVPYICQPHQVEWHLQDVNFVRRKAKNRVVVKSRNTSFTTSAIISNLMAIPEYKNPIVPFVRLNIRRAEDLISKDTISIIKNMKPMLLDDGSFFPFDPRKVDMSARGKIVFPNGTEFRAFPATADSAETIRGLRLRGCAGIIDESAFIRDFKRIYISLRDAFAGTDDGSKEFQMNIGTTLKGRATHFSEWFEKIDEKKMNFKIFKWPVFDPTKLNYDVPFTEQNLDPIVFWQDSKDLWEKYLEDDLVFREEYMAELVDSDTSFYKYNMTITVIDNELENLSKPIIDPNNPIAPIFLVGVDVASINDYFVISTFEELEINNNKEYFQRNLQYYKNVELDKMQELLERHIEIWNPNKMFIDSNGMGFQIGQSMKKKYKNQIVQVRGSRLKMGKGKSVPLNEALHTNMKKLMTTKRIHLINDELQIRHYSMWDYNYKAQVSKEWGHGDIVMANGYALLHINKEHSKVPLISNLTTGKVQEEEVINKPETIQEKIERLRALNNMQ